MTQSSYLRQRTEKQLPGGENKELDIENIEQYFNSFEIVSTDIEMSRLR